MNPKESVHDRILAVTPGDPDGIGPEIVWKAVRGGRYRDRGAHLLCVGARAPFDRISAPVFETSPEALERGELPPTSLGPVIWLLPAPNAKPRSVPGHGGKPVRSLEGFQAGWSIVRATELVRRKQASALVTGPISKERLQLGGYAYPGHTEFLAKLCRDRRVTPHVTMMLANDQLRVTLATTHLALKDVPRALSREVVRRTIQETVSHLRTWFGIAHPRVAIAALNPHAGEAGLFGTEEIRVVTPVVRALQKAARGAYTLAGPLPADTLFAKHAAAPREERFDAVVCMYHDQGLIPVKLLDFPKTVNVTLGLPIVRTSVDHGVGFDIVGTGKADPSSFQSAVELALQIVERLELGARNVKDEAEKHDSRNQALHLS